MKKFFILLKKEIRELITPLLIVPLVAMVAIFSGIGVLTQKEAEKAKKPQPITILDSDRSPLSDTITSGLTQAGMEVMLLTDTTQSDALTRAQANGSIALAIIPDGFSEGIAKAQPQNLEVYSFLHSMSQTAARNEGTLRIALAAINESVSNALITQGSQLDPAVVKQPIKLTSHVVLNDKQADVSITDVIGFVQSQTYFVPIILFLVITFAAQMIATSIASEKENKTLETLLTAPVGRQTIVAAKLLAAGLVALVFAGVYILAFRSYMNGVTGGELLTTSSTAQSALTTLGLKFGAGDYALLGTSLFFGILSALAIALILGAFAEDVKSIQGVITPLMVLILVPYFLILFLDFTALSPIVQWLVYAIPFSHPFLATQNIVFENYTALTAGIIYQAAVFLVFVFIAGRIFSTDAIVTMKLSWGKKR